MKTVRLTDEAGKTAIIQAPDDATEAEINAFADASWDSWRDGATYRMVPDDGPSMQIPPAVQESRDAFATQIKAGEQTAAPGEDPAAAAARAVRNATQESGVFDRNSKTRAPMGPQAIERAVALDTFPPEKPTILPGGAWKNAKAIAYGVPDATQTVLQNMGASAVGGLAKHLVDTPARRAMGAAPNPLPEHIKQFLSHEPQNPVSKWIVDTIGIPGEYLNKGIEAVSPGKEGEIVHDVVKKSLEIAPWGLGLPAGNAAKALAAERAAQAAPGLGTQVSDALGVTERVHGQAPGNAPAAAVVDEIQKRTGYVPTQGEISGLQSPREVRARKYAPEVFHASETAMEKAARDIKNEALDILDPQQLGINRAPYSAQDLGSAIRDVTEKARETLSKKTGPVFDEAQNAGLVVDVRAYRNEAEKWLKERSKALSKAERAELDDILKDTADSVGADNMLVKGTDQPLRDVQDMISRNKDRGRALADGNSASPLFKKILVDLNKKLDDAYGVALAGADPALKDRVMAARDLYRDTLRDIDSDTMATLLRKKPEDMGRSLHAAGTVTEIQELRAAMNRAVKNDPALAGEISHIDASLVRGYLEEANVGKLTDKLEAAKFRDTMKEILLGRGAANPAQNLKVLKELDKAIGAIHAAHPQLLKEGGRVSPPGLSARVAPATVGIAATGNTMAGVSLGLAASTLSALGGRAYYQAVARAMTKGGSALPLQSFSRAMQLAAATSRNPKAEPALEDAIRRLNEDLAREGIEPISIR